MSHFSDEAWADFARGAGEPHERERLQSHLDGGCSPCSTQQRLWDSVNRLAGREAGYRPPDAAIRRAKALFAQRRPPSFLGRLSKAVSLLFDSMSAPLPVGVRASAQSSRQLLYSDGSRVLRLRIERQDDAERLSVVGQVLDERDPGRELGVLPVLVQSGRRTTARTLTNRFGEFELELAPATTARLVVGAPGRDALAVSLPIERRAPGRGASLGVKEFRGRS